MGRGRGGASVRNYSVSPFLGAVERCENVVAVTRLRSNRRLYHLPDPRQPGQRGRPRVYGAAFRLNQPATWGEPDEVDTLEVLRGGRRLTITLKAWHNKLLTGDDHGRQVHRVTLVYAEARDEAGQRVYDRPLWLAVSGPRRHELTARQAYAVYGRRFDQEHGHRFMRQRLLFDAFQTCETEHEENWVTLVALAYAQLFAAREVADDLPRPWERRSQVAGPGAALSPTRVQRGFGSILAVLGTPARAPQRRGKSPGRSVGVSSARPIDRPLTKRRRKAA